MKKYAIIQLQGKQYQVQEGDVFIVDCLNAEADSRIKVTDVLLMVDGKTCNIGQPLVDKASVELKVVSEQKGPKLRVSRFKAKSRYRKVKGHRQLQSTVEVVKIG